MIYCILNSQYYPLTHSKTFVQIQTLRTKLTRKLLIKTEQNVFCYLFNSIL